MIALLVTGAKASWLDRLDPLFECINWNALNQLTAVSKNAVAQASYSYDSVGCRVEMIAGTTTTGLVYDFEDLVRRDATTASGARPPPSIRPGHASSPSRT